MNEFTQEQIMSYDKYRELCWYFFQLAKDKAIESRLKEILYEGRVGDYTFSSVVPHKNTPEIECGRRISLAYLLLNNPDTFAYFVQNDIKIFHGTNANALPSILKYGINSFNSLEANKIPILTGEDWSRNKEGRNFVSFSDVLDISRDYAAISAQKGVDELSFPVVLGTSDACIKPLKKTKVNSDLPEIGIDKLLPKESIKCICVPSSKVDFVKKMVQDPNIAVLGMNNYRERFYCFDEYFFIDIFPDLFEKYKKQNAKKDLNFSVSELVSLAKTRKALKMQEFIKRLKDKNEKWLVKEKEQAYGRNI